MSSDLYYDFSQSQPVYPQQLNEDESYNDYGFIPDPTTDNSLNTPSQQVGIKSEIVIVDSRDRRDYYKTTPSMYTITLPRILRNINQVELKGSIIPKTEYNVNSA